MTDPYTARATRIFLNLSTDERQACAASPYAALGAIQSDEKGLGGIEQDFASLTLQALCAAAVSA